MGWGEGGGRREGGRSRSRKKEHSLRGGGVAGEGYARLSQSHPCLNGYSVSRADSRECASSRYATLGNAGQVLAALVGEGQRRRERGWNGGVRYVRVSTRGEREHVLRAN